MIKGKESRIKELVNKYKELDNKEKENWSMMIYFYRDEKRKIKKVFLKEMHQPIDNFL